MADWHLIFELVGIAIAAGAVLQSLKNVKEDLRELKDGMRTIHEHDTRLAVVERDLGITPRNGVRVPFQSRHDDGE